MLEEVLNLEALTFEVSIEQLEGSLFDGVLLTINQQLKFKLEEFLRLLTAPNQQNLVDLVIFAVVHQSAEELDNTLLLVEGLLPVAALQ